MPSLAGLPPRQLYVHQDGAAWDFMLIQPASTPPDKSEALDAAWQGLVDGDTAVVEWVLAYRDARGDRSLIVTFADSARVVGRGAREYFGVTYPADRLLAHGDDQVAEMRSAIITVLDRHVRGAGLDVPPVSEVCGPPA